MTTSPVPPTPPRPTAFRRSRLPAWRRHWQVYAMLLPVALYYLVFHYGPMYGVLIAFKDFSPAQGILGSPWVGWKWFEDFFSSYYFIRILRNTLLINVYDLIFGFTAPILLALLLNEVRGTWFRRLVQSVTYLPHFISVVVISGLAVSYTHLTLPTI